jgi:iron-chelate-transporting ATPase
MTNTGPAQGLFALDRVGVAIGGRQLLENVTLSMPAGGILGLIGHNGSGKSTLLKVLARQLQATTGSIQFAGRPLTGWSGRSFARKVAYLPQSPPPTSGLLVRELVALGRYPWHGALGRFGSGDHASVDEAMRLTRVDSFAGREVDTLSGGERQRVWLAMLMAQKADCLLLDEPISALDVAHQVEVMALVQDLSRQHGVAILMVLHDVNLAARYCDQLVALRGGRVLAQGSPRELMRSDVLEAIYGLPMGIIPHPVTGRPMTYLL